MMKYILLIISLILLPKLNAQDETAINDSISYRYNFAPGDTLIYVVQSWDSISINFETPTLKNRFEKIRITCDSVNPKNGHYYMTHTLIDFLSLESHADIKGVRRTETPWLNRPVFLEIDSLGNRYSVQHDDEFEGAIAPGGGFQAYLLFSLHKEYGQVGHGWMDTSTDTLAENGVPSPMLIQSSYYRAMGGIDTLDHYCNRVEITKTGRGALYVPVDQDKKFKVNVVINGFGLLDISADLAIPVHYYTTMEHKLKLFDQNQVERPGYHYISTHFLLDKYIPAQGKKEVKLKTTEAQAKVY